MVCRYVRTIFHNKENGYCIFLYETEEDTVPEQVKSKQTGKTIRSGYPCPPDPPRSFH